MILDAQALFSDSQALTATAVSTNAYNLKKVSQDVGTGERLYLYVTVVTAFTDSGSDSTVAVTLVTDDNDALSSATAVQTLGTFAALSAVGSKLVVPIASNLTLEQYIGLNYTLANGNLTTGAVTAGIVTEADLYKVYPKGYTIS